MKNQIISNISEQIASYLDLITASASLSGISAETVSAFLNTNTYSSFECLQCTPALISGNT